MQVGPDELPTVMLVDRGAPRSRKVTLPASAGNVTRSGGPAPSSHQESWGPHLSNVVLLHFPR
jgi:hypothetical protein